MDANTIPANPPVRAAAADSALSPLFQSQDPRPMAISAALAGIIVPIVLSTLGMLLVFLGQWTNPLFLCLACVAGVNSLVLSTLIGINRLKNRPVRPSWVAGVIVLTMYLGPATAMVGFVRLLDQITGVFEKAMHGSKSPHLPFDLDPRVDMVSTILLTVCAAAFIIGCAVFWLEVVALRHRIGQIERMIGKTGV